MGSFVDLHCHWVEGIDDGARTLDETVSLLTGLGSIGFGHVVATPHMRPGMFDNDSAKIRAAFESTKAALGETALPELSLGCEHYFDSVVLERIEEGTALPYEASSGPRRAILVEFLDLEPTAIVERFVFRLGALGYLPVIAHPERYRAVWAEPERAQRLGKLGAALLLDIAALEGKYGQRARTTAEWLLEHEAYDAACSDSHRPSDIEIVGRSMDVVGRRYGAGELDFLFDTGPRSILGGRRPTAG